MIAFIARPPRFCVLCAPGTPWSSRWRSCIEHTRVASAAPWSNSRTAWLCCCGSRPLRPPSLASGVSRHPSQASSRVSQRSCRRGISQSGFVARSQLRIGTDPLSFVSTLKSLGISSRVNLEKIRKRVAKRTFEAHDLMLRSYYAVKFSSSSSVDFS